MLDEPADKFRWPEYVVFGVMLAISAGIGVFHGCFGGKQKTTSEFLMADRSMHIFPMAMSLIASFISAITMLGTPVEMYQYGTQYWVIGLSYFFVMCSAGYVYMPVFFRMQLTSAYEYLEVRFAKPVRLLGSTIFTFQMNVYMAIVVYAPALALAQVTGINVYFTVVAIFVVCIFYTALGGMKAVMWTDTFQVFVMFLSMLVVIIKASIDIGGGQVIWDRALEGGRVEFFNFNPDPRTRHSVWCLVIGGYFSWTAIYGTNQAEVQRYLTVPSQKKARQALLLNTIGLFAILSICAFGGLVLYAKYHDCHPIYSGRVKKPDQLFPLLVMDSLWMYPGLPGLFVAGIFSGALSTVSSGLNSLAAIFLEDFIKGTCYPQITDKRASILSKVLTIFFGLVSFALVFLAERLGGVLQAALSLFGMTGGPLLGVFSLGMFFPWANAKGAFIGTITSLIFMFWLGIGSQMAMARGELVFPKLNFTTEGCPANSTITIPPFNPGKEGGILEFYRISYMWYSAMGCSISVLVGLIVSLVTQKNPRKHARQLDVHLISPPVDKLVRWILSEKQRKYIGWEMGDFVEKKRKISTTNGHGNNGIINSGFEPDAKIKSDKNGFERSVTQVETKF